MSLTRTDHAQAQTTTPAASFTTGSYTFPNGEPIVVMVHSVNNGGAENPASQITISDTGAGLTWTPQVRVDNAAGEDYAPAFCIFTATGNGTSCTLTVSKTGVSANTWLVRPFTWSGAHASPFGATMSAAPAVSDGAASGTLSASPASTSEVIGGLTGTLSDASASSVTEGSGCTKIYDYQNADVMEGAGQSRTGSTSTTFGFADVQAGSNTYYHNPVMGAIEIIAAAASDVLFAQALT